MSQANVDLVLAVGTAPDVDWAQLFRDDETWATAAEVAAPFVHPDVETVFPTVPGDRTYTGLDGFRTGMLDWLAPWATYRAEAEEAIDCGDRVLLLRRAFGRLEGSAEEVAIAGAAVFTVRDGKIARIEAYADQAEALKAWGWRSRRVRQPEPRALIYADWERGDCGSRLLARLSSRKRYS